ncbi:secretion/conjugation apparatus DotM-related subunit [Marinobacter gelidimuriae]|uniref:secretion/conjugation apparatus DotM-related subunit n=1 Tax=Marinobacter gelidimuriae TaxID=2739064 RepID=UPI0004773F0C|nr:hypothetical protein [Marinobacter gelidimuriae]
MAANSGQGQGERDQMMENMIMFFVIIGVLFLAAWMTWRHQQEVILTGLFWSVGWLSKAVQFVPFLYPDAIARNLGNWSHTLIGLDPAPYGWETAKLMIRAMTHSLTLIFAPLIVWRLFSLRQHFIINRFTRRFDLYDLKASRVNDYAAIASIQHEDLLKIPLYEGPLAINHAPIDFALLNQLLVVHKRSVGQAALEAMRLKGKSQTHKPRPIKGWTEKKMRWSVEERRRVLPPPQQCRLDIQAADQRLRDQTGSLFNVKNLDVFEKCVLAILLTANAEGLGPAGTLALRLAKSFRRLDAKNQHNPTINAKGVNAIIKRNLEHPVVKQVRKKHAFTTTFFMGLLECCWKKGIFTTPNFLWLKPVNRTLYLSLCSLGGDRPYSEALGPWSHYMVENVKGHAVTHPCIEGGTDALKEMLFSDEWIGSDEGLASDIAELKALEAGNDDEYSPTRGVDLFDPPAPKKQQGKS